jgi:hypothetical protein
MIYIYLYTSSKAALQRDWAGKRYTAVGECRTSKVERLDRNKKKTKNRKKEELTHNDVKARKKGDLLSYPFLAFVSVPML